VDFKLDQYREVVRVGLRRSRVVRSRVWWNCLLKRFFSFKPNARSPCI